jgi:hypothetical protein
VNWPEDVRTPFGKPGTMVNCCMGPAGFCRCAHAQQLRTRIANGTLTPESWRDEEKPDLGSAWENAVRRIYQLEREVEPLRAAQVDLVMPRDRSSVDHPEHFASSQQ